MKKVFILLMIIFLVILIFLIIALNLISGKKEAESVLTITPIPTIYYNGSYSRPKTNLTPTQDNLLPSITQIIIEKPTPISQINKINFKEISKKVYILPKKDINQLEALKKNLPVANENFAVDYSYVLDLFIIQKKTKTADEKIKTWADANGISKLIEKKDIFQITDKSTQEYKQAVEQKYQQNQNSSVESQSKSTDNSSTNPDVTPQTNSLNQLIDIFKNVFNNETLKKFAISITPTGKPNPTGSNNNNNSVPASLTQLFNEVGTKVGVPPKIIEGVLKIESPASFNFSSEEIAEYSKPGSIIPGCGPNLCSATGPMQMTIGIDDLGNTSCPRCGAGYCPNAWAGYGSSVNYYGSYTHNPNPCNLRDNIYAAADKLKKDSGATDPSNWTEEEVYRAASRYYGRCDDNYRYSRLDNKTYCEYLWWYYKNSSSNSGTSGKPGFSYYCQGNTEWKNNCSLGRAGCAPTSLAMITSSFGVQMTPSEVDAVFQQNGWRACGDNASYLIAALNSSWFANLGFTVGPNIAPDSKLDIQEAKKYIDNGFLLIASSRAYPCASCSTVNRLIDHAFVVDNVDESSNSVSIRDPNNCSYNDGNDENESKRIKNISDFPWLYAYPIKKI